MLSFIDILRVSSLFIRETGQSLAVATSSRQTQTKPCCKSQHMNTFPSKQTTTSVCLCVEDADSVPVLALESVGVEPVELERGGIFVLLLLLLFAFGFFSILRPNSGERASELFSIKRGEQRVIVNAGQATKALIHFCQTRRLHYGDILTTDKPRKIETQSKCLSKKKAVR